MFNIILIEQSESNFIKLDIMFKKDEKFNQAQ